MNLRNALEYGKQILLSANIPDGANDAWLLLSHVTGITRAAYFMDAERELTEEQEQDYKGALQKRQSRIPLQHITGEQEFMGLCFIVNEHVLIPRQDTEILVEEVLAHAKPKSTVLDMCTGSGCIAVSLSKYGEELQVVAADISKEALIVAQENGKAQGVAVSFLQSDLFENVQGTYDVIVSNPPYIPTKVIEQLEAEVKLHDPMQALDGKEDGLYFYRKIIAESPKYLKNQGTLFFEIGHDQGADVSLLMREAGFEHVTVKKDLAGLDRVVFGVYNT